MVRRLGIIAIILIPLGMGWTAAALQSTLPWEKTASQAGRMLYREHCIVCHEIEQADDHGKVGPSLYRLFQNEKLPSSGGVPNEPYVRVKIQFGGDVMPPYVNTLSAEQITILVEYIRSKK